MKLPEDGQILGCNFILLHKFQHDGLQEWSHRNVKMTSQRTKFIYESFLNETDVGTLDLDTSKLNHMLVIYGPKYMH